MYLAKWRSDSMAAVGQKKEGTCGTAVDSGRARGGLSDINYSVEGAGDPRWPLPIVAVVRRQLPVVSVVDDDKSLHEYYYNIIQFPYGPWYTHHRSLILSCIVIAGKYILWWPVTLLFIARRLSFVADIGCWYTILISVSYFSYYVLLRLSVCFATLPMRIFNNSFPN